MIGSPIELPCGAVLPNRLAKAALSEQLGDAHHAPSEQLIRLYQRWSKSGAGLLVTGNIMVDRNAVTEPANVVVEGRRDLDKLRRWARVAKAGGATVIAQVSHPGRQVPMSIEGTDEVRDRFARTARVLIAAGFDGIQLHGDPVNRRGVLLDLVEGTREAIGEDRILAVKLDSGTYSDDESIEVARALAAAGIDLLEIGGRTRERAAMTRAQVGVPLMVTGGFRTRADMEAALSSGAVDVVGLGRPMAVQPEAPARLLSGSIGSLEPITGKRPETEKLDGLAETGWYTSQLWRMGRGKDPATDRATALGVAHYVLGGVGYSMRKRVS